MKKTLRNFGLAALLSFNVAVAPVGPVSSSDDTVLIDDNLLSSDIYGKNIMVDYGHTVPEKDIYNMIDRAMYWNPGPSYADAKYHRALTFHESTDDPYAVNYDSTALGLRQMKRIAWESVTDEDYDSNVFNPQANITAAVMYTNDIDRMLRHAHPQWYELSYSERRDLNTAANNGGITKLIGEGFDISKMYKETRDYVEKVNKFYKEN